MSRATSRLWMAAGVATLIAVGASLGHVGTRAVGIAVGIAVPVTALLAVTLVAQPASFVLFYAASRPLIDSVVFLQLGGLTLGMVWSAGLIVSAGYYWLARGIRRPVPTGWLMPFGFVLAYALFALGRPGLSSVELFTAVTSCLKAALFVLIGLTCDQIASSTRGQNLIVRAGLLMAVLTLVPIAAAIARNEYGVAKYTMDVSDTLGQTAHGLAGLALLTSAFAWIAVMRGRVQWRWILLAGLLGAGVVLSFVRTVLLAFALMVTWLLVSSVRRKRTGSVMSAFVVVAGGAGILYVFRDLVAQRFVDFSYLWSGGGMAEYAGSSRIGIWQAVLHSATSSPAAFLLGQGPVASYRAAYAATGMNVWSHNDFLEYLVTGGIGLLALYVAVLAWLLVSMTRLALDSRQSTAVHDVAGLITTVVVAVAFMSFVNGGMLDGALPLALLVGLARGMYRTPGLTFVDGDGQQAADSAGAGGENDLLSQGNASSAKGRRNPRAADVFSLRGR